MHYYVPKRSILFAGNGEVKISSVACGFSPVKKVSEYDQEIPQSQIADNPMARRGRAAQPSRDTRKTN